MKKQLQPTIFFILFVIFLAVSVFSFPGTTAAAAAGAALEKTQINYCVAIVSSMSLLPSWVAEKRGFLKEEGFTEVKFLPSRGSQSMSQFMVSGVTDVTISAPGDMLSLILKGYKLKAVWAGYNLPFFEWYAQPKFKSFAETKGGTYACTQFGSLTEDLTRVALMKAGLDPNKDIKMLQLGGSPQSLAAMEAGQIDATILSAPNTYVAAEKGFVKLGDQRDVIAPDWPLHVVFLKEEFIAKNPNTVKAFLRAHSKAINWIKANPGEAAKVANDVYKFKLEHCQKFIEQYKNDWYADGRMASPEGMKALWDVLIRLGEIKEPVPNNIWLDETFLKTQNQWLK